VDTFRWKDAPNYL
jgi:hypothetical protein